MILTAKQGRGDKIHLLVDGEYQFTVDREFWFSQGIASGADIPREQLDRLREEAAFRRAYRKALGLLSYSMRSRRSLVERLVRDEIPPALAERAADQLEEYGLLDDVRYAELYAQELLRNKKLSVRGIRDKLITRGIDRDTAQEVLEGLAVDEEEGIEALLRGKLAYFSRSPGDRSRAAAALVRRGYGYADIRRVMERLAEELENGDESCPIQLE